MKPRNKVKRLLRKQKVFDDLEPTMKKGRIRPGSVKKE